MLNDFYCTLNVLTKSILHSFCNFSGRDEVATAMGNVVQGVNKGLISPEDVTEELLDKTMQLTTPDLLVRTSGEVRLSDFMIWQVVCNVFIRHKYISRIVIYDIPIDFQVSNTCLYFTSVLWPEFRIWHLLTAIINFQRVSSNDIPSVEDNEKHALFLNDVDCAKWKTLEKYAQAC